MNYTTKKQGKTLIHIEKENIHVTLMDYGATIYDIKTPDQNNNLESVVLKYNDLSSYTENKIYLNTTVGPIAGRTKNAQFKLNNKIHNLERNDTTNNLHTGSIGISFKTFDYTIIEEDTTKVIFTLHTNDYIGTQNYKIIYEITNDSLHINYLVDTNEDIILNLTNHAYFNLSGNTKRDILNHRVSIKADKYMLTDQLNVPVKPSIITKKLNLNNKKTIKNITPLDHQFLLTNSSLTNESATLYDPESKRELRVYTTYPCIVSYTHNYPSDDVLYQDIPQKQHQGICFEAQYVSNGINIENVNKAILRKEDIYNETVMFQFCIKEGLDDSL